MSNGLGLIEKKPYLGGDVYLGEFSIPAGVRLEQHRHTFDHLSYLVKGTVDLDVEGDVTRLDAPSCLTIEKGKVHGITALTDTVWACIHHTKEHDPEKVEAGLIMQPESTKLAMVERGVVDVQPLAWALRENPQLWDAYDVRTIKKDSPHHGTHDIFVRWCPEGFNGGIPHDSVWYAPADILPVKPIVKALMASVGGEKLGGVFITKIPPGKMVQPHIDDAWHANYYEKYGISIESAPGQFFCVDQDKLETRPGDLFTFNNSYLHWVTNPTGYDRITLIVCIRR
jgi:Aspartyl/Asparaginyl beta-hydroxylase